MLDECGRPIVAHEGSLRAPKRMASKGAPGYPRTIPQRCGSCSCPEMSWRVSNHRLSCAKSHMPTSTKCSPRLYGRSTNNSNCVVLLVADDCRCPAENGSPHEPCEVQSATSDRGGNPKSKCPHSCNTVWEMATMLRHVTWPCGSARRWRLSHAPLQGNITRTLPRGSTTA